MNQTNAYDARRQGQRRLSALTIGATTASLLGVGAVVAYDAHLLDLHSLTSQVTARTDDGARGDDGSAQLQPATTSPSTTQQAPVATSGGS